MLITAVCACGVVNKSKQASSSKTDSSGVITHNEATTQKLDSTGKKAILINTEEKKSSDTSHSLFILFNAGDSAFIRSYQPIKFFTDPAGYTIFDPGGRTIKSITDTRKKNITQSKTVTQAGSDSTHSVSNWTHVKGDSTGTHIKKEIEQSGSNVFRFQLPWYAYLIAGLLAIAIWQFWPYLRKKKNDPALPTK